MQLMKDHLGSTRAAMNGSTGEGIEYNAYNAWGELMASQTSPDVAYKYTGQEYDQQTGIYNYRARMYDEQIGRFYAIDPAGVGFSPYNYGANNPVSFTDPSGNAPVWYSDYLKASEEESRQMYELRREQAESAARLSALMAGGSDFGLALMMADEVTNVSYFDWVFGRDFDLLIIGKWTTTFKDPLTGETHTIEVIGEYGEGGKAAAQLFKAIDNTLEYIKRLNEPILIAGNFAVRALEKLGGIESPYDIILDINNVEILHEGYATDNWEVWGYGPTGVGKEKYEDEGYTKRGREYSDDIMIPVINDLKPIWDNRGYGIAGIKFSNILLEIKSPLTKYQNLLGYNCQDWADAMRAEYWRRIYQR